MRINIFVPGIYNNTVAGGMYCIFKYAQGLLECGHEVTLVAYPWSRKPDWIEYSGEFYNIKWMKQKCSNLTDYLQNIIYYIDYITFRAKSPIRRFATIYELSDGQIPDADVSLATYWETAYLVNQYGTGKKYYFMQHYEPLFYAPGSVQYIMAKGTYSLPLTKITNSSWLRNKIITHDLLSKQEEGTVHQCINAVDLDKYYPQVPGSDYEVRNKEKEISIISYGGRNAVWKGFKDMAIAVRIIREQLPDWRINWNVYGAALLSANNNIAPYNNLGYLKPDQLRQAYQENDILLSASWYESFPLFPIEAMACGLPVITTEPGTEDYAVDNINVIYVIPRNTASIAGGLKKLILDKEIRYKLRENGLKTAQSFKWCKSIENMESIILN